MVELTDMIIDQVGKDFFSEQGYIHIPGLLNMEKTACGADGNRQNCPGRSWY